MQGQTTQVLTEVPSKRLEGACKVLDKLGMQPSEAINLFLEQISIRQEIPFELTAKAGKLLEPEEQGVEWTKAMGAY